MKKRLAVTRIVGLIPMGENGNTFFSGTKPAAILSVNLAGEYQKGNLQNNLTFAAS